MIVKMTVDTEEEDIDIDEENPVIIHAIELDGCVYPPLYASCRVCCYSRMSNHFDPDKILVCGYAGRYMEADSYCGNFDLDIGEWDCFNELEDYLNEHPELIEDVIPELYEDDM
jgi:hypothetical protein